MKNSVSLLALVGGMMVFLAQPVWSMDRDEGSSPPITGAKRKRKDFQEKKQNPGRNEKNLKSGDSFENVKQGFKFVRKVEEETKTNSSQMEIEEYELGMYYLMEDPNTGEQIRKPVRTEEYNRRTYAGLNNSLVGELDNAINLYNRQMVKTENLENALSLFKKVANLQITLEAQTAQVYLGKYYCYDKKDKTQEDLEIGINWYNIAAKQGNEEAQMVLKDLKGERLKKDEDEMETD